MKKIVISSLVLVLFSQLSARENPFYPTNMYQEELARHMEAEDIEKLKEKEFIKEFTEKINQKSEQKKKAKQEVKKTPIKVKKNKEKIYSKKEVSKLIKKAQIQTERRAKQLIKKELRKVKDTKPQQVVYVKPRVNIFEEDKNDDIITEKILPFLTLSYNDDTITLDTQYKVLRKFEIEEENKLIIDYRANKSFYTQREDLSSKNFKKIAVGNHKKNRYFRVVIKLVSNPENYTVKKNEEGLITISTNEI